MIYEYPDWVEDFVCIADECEDTCCAGWEVDIDEGTLELYRSAEGAFGERLRGEIREENGTGDGGCFFPLTQEGRCPFLNDRNLCDIITNLGPDAISMVCDEYPRYFVTVGDYEQMDMSLSCMELGRLFFAGLLIAQLLCGFFHFADGIFREGYARPAAQDHGDSGLGDACIFCQISCRDLISFTHLFLLSGLPVPLSADVCRGFQPFFETLFRKAFRNVLPLVFTF